ncbi:hypothetical protein [Actinoplanes sp. NPDC048796]|uniref:hypothetical protein n=1 Tax=Actinoplanes sp. NPDC048796 TaxID=3155640 RepID=UPI0033DA5B23
MATVAALATSAAYQSITDRRLSKAPSQRDAHTMRRQFALALGIMELLAVALSSAIQSRDA